MKTKFTFSKTFLIFAIALMLAAGELWSQQFIQQTAGAQYNASCSGVIKIKSNCGTPNVAIDNAFVNEDGNTLGTATKPIPGIVDWASKATGQEVQVLYYESLVVSGGTKTIPTGVVVTGKGDCSPLLAGYTDLTGYPFAIIPGTDDVTFVGDFTYDSDGPVNIFPVVGPNNYDNLVIAGTGPATIPDDKVVETNKINTGTDEETKLIVSGDLIITGGEDNKTSNLGGEVTISAGGSITTGTGDVTFGDDLAINGSLTLPDFTTPSGGTNGTVTLEGTTTIGGTGSIELEDNTDLVVSGDITNGGNGENLLFSCSSTVTYNQATESGTQIIMPTLNSDTHRYGNLVLSGNAKQGGVVASTYGTADYADIYTCGDLTVTGTNLDMALNTGVLFLTKTDAAVTYGTGNDIIADREEVVGRFGRNIGGSTNSLIFNNSATIFTVTQDAADLTSLTLDVRPGSHEDIPNAGAGVTDGFDVATDVNRQIRFSYETVADPKWVSTLQVGFRSTEDPTNGTSNLRYREVVSITETEKVATGDAIVREVNQDFRYVSLEGIRPTGSNSDAPSLLAEVANDAWLYLSGAATKFYTVNDGRWTNPGTWDEGTLPTHIDDAEIRHMVYVGIAGPFAGTLVEDNTTPEKDIYGEDGAAAKTITIAQKKDAIDSPNPSLIIGNEDNGDYVFKTAAAGTSFTNLNTDVPSPSLAFPLAVSKSDIGSSSVFTGLWLIPIGNGVPAFGTSQIENSGTINNEGIIELGNCE